MIRITDKRTTKGVSFDALATGDFFVFEGESDLYLKVRETALRIEDGMLYSFTSHAKVEEVSVDISIIDPPTAEEID